MGSAAPPDALATTNAKAATLARSRKVRKILRLEARARRLLARYEQALATTARTMSQACALLDDAQVLESSLTGVQLTELHRGRAAALPRIPAPESVPPDGPSKTTP
jgi:hypothetical protein